MPTGEHRAFAPVSPAVSKVFVSYSRDDIPFVRDVVLRLKAAGVNVWIDLLELPVGKSYVREIETAIQAATHCVVVVSRYSMNSKEVAWEMEIAQRLGKTVIPIILHAAKMPPWMKELQWVDCRVEFDAPMQRLTRVLGGERTEPIADERALVAPRRLKLEGPERNLCPGHVTAVAVLLGMAVAMQALPPLLYAVTTGLTLWPVYLIDALIAATVMIRLRAFVSREAEHGEIIVLPTWILTLPLWSLPGYWIVHGDLHRLLTFANACTIILTLCALVLAWRSPAVRRWAISYTEAPNGFLFLGLRLGRKARVAAP